MDFSRRLAAIRKQRGMTQYAVADAAGINVSQVRRYEGGTCQPSLEVLRKLAVALSVSADELLFEQEERGPDDDLKLQFEAAARLDPDEKRLIKELIEGVLIKHESKRWIRREAAS
jgi:transcriptional regulator with XRE-family HTH domain